MKNLESKQVSTETRCPACDGKGFPTVTQPKQPGRKIYPAPCKQCLGKGNKGRITPANPIKRRLLSTLKAPRLVRTRKPRLNNTAGLRTSKAIRPTSRASSGTK